MAVSKRPLCFPNLPHDRGGFFHLFYVRPVIYKAKGMPIKKLLKTDSYNLYPLLNHVTMAKFRHNDSVKCLDGLPDNTVTKIFMNVLPVQKEEPALFMTFS
jgi:hypothetical protein